jgi:uncharacterized protein (DUF58 family)
LFLRQTDAVALGVFDSEVRTYLPPSARLEHIHDVLSTLEATQPVRRTDLASILHGIASALERRGLVVVISDLFDDVDSIIAGLQHLRFAGQEVVVFHVLDPAELAFPFSGVVQLRGLEGTGTATVEPRRIRQAYQAELQAYLTRLRHACGRNRVDLFLVNTATPMDVTLTGYLIKRMSLAHG